jgi:PatG Domain
MDDPEQTEAPRNEPLVTVATNQLGPLPDHEHTDDRRTEAVTRTAIQAWEPHDEGAVRTVIPQSCPSCGTQAPDQLTKDKVAPRIMQQNYIYAIGRIEARFPKLSVEKELAQVTGLADTAGLTDREALQRVLSQRDNRYLVRQLCWVLTVQGLDTYIVVPRDPADLDLLVESLRPTPTPMDLDCIIGVQGPIAPPDMCGLAVPIVVVDQLYSFDRTALIKNIPRPDGASEKEFRPAAEEVFDRIMQITDNAGATDEHRALNYLALRYPAIYVHAAAAFSQNKALTAVNVTRSPLSGTRNMVDVILSFTDRSMDVTEKHAVRVDVTEEFPFLAKKLSPFYDR